MPPSHSNTSAIRLLTFNTFLLDVNLQSRKTAAQRIKLITPEIARLDPDIIVLQEVWGQHYRRFLQRAFAQRGWRFSTRACPIPTVCASTKLTAGFTTVGGLSAVQVARTSGWSRRAFIAAATGSMLLAGGAAIAKSTLRDYGNGLLIISRWPILDTAAMSFRNHTRLDEALVYKGAVRARIRIPKARTVDVINTHLGARSFDFERGCYEPVTSHSNAQQLDELIDWLGSDAGQGTSPADATILAGDLNFNPWVVAENKITAQRSQSYSKLVAPPPSGLGLTDTFAAANGTVVGGFTAGPANGFGAQQASAPRRKPPERIDYIFSSAGASVSSSRVVLADALRDRPDGDRIKRKLGFDTLPLHVSDHFGLLSTVELSSKSPRRRMATIQIGD